MTMNRPSSITLKDLLAKINDDLCCHTQNSTEKLQADFLNNAKNYSLTICLGAGVTIGFIGRWNALLNKIASIIFKNKLFQRSTDSNHPYHSVSLSEDTISSFIDSYNSALPDSISALEKGEYLAAECGSSPFEKMQRSMFYDSYEYSSSWRELVFAQTTLDALYCLLTENMSTEDDPVTVNPDLEKTLINFFLEKLKNGDSKYNTLKEVIALCYCGKVSSIIDYNFDTILEILLSSKDVFEYFSQNIITDGTAKPCHLQVYNPFFDHENPLEYFSSLSSDGYHPIRIDHVHGLLDRHVPLAPIIFSEESYVNIQRAALHWSTVAIAKAITDGVMLCVGFSGDDSDFRTICQRLMENYRISNTSSHFSAEQLKSHIYLVAALDSRIKKLITPLFDSKKKAQNPGTDSIFKGKNADEIKQLVSDHISLLKNKIHNSSSDDMSFSKEETENTLKITEAYKSSIEDKIIMSDEEMACTYEIVYAYIAMVKKYYKNLLNVEILFGKNHDCDSELLEKIRKA